MRIGVHPAVVVSSSELAKECFTTLDVAVSSRPKSTTSKLLTYDYASFAFTAYGDYWREIHKIVVSELLSPRRLELHQGIRESEVQSALKAVHTAWAEKRGDLLVDMKQCFGDVTLNVILRMVAGKRYCTGSVDDEEQVRRVRRVLRDFFRLIGYSVIGDAIPFLGWLDLGGAAKEMKKTAIEMDRIVSEWLKEHRQRRDSDETETLKDFIDVLLPALDGVDLAGYDADTVIKATCSTLIASAIDTTTITMLWALSLMLNNRHVLKGVQEELDEHIGKERLVNKSDINKLEYLQAVVKETLRLYPAAPLLGLREFSKDCILGGYHIRAGTRFIFNAWKLHRDPGVWSNPLEFQPQRFLTTHKDVDVKGQHFELIPFGAGRRACPGIPFGIQMTLLALAAFLQAFEITTLNNAQVDMSATFGLTVIKTSPLEILVRPRLPYQLLSE